MPETTAATAAGTIDLGGDLTVQRMGFGAMRLTGQGIWGEPTDPDECRAVLRRAIELGIDFIDTADSYGPEVSERLVAEALHPYPDNPLIATQGGLGSRALARIADAHGATTHQTALAWLLARSPAMLPIPGTASVAHLEENVAAGSLRLSQAEVDELGL